MGEIFSGIFGGGPSRPSPPPMPPMVDRAAEERRRKEREAKRRRSGRVSSRTATVLTGGAGDASDAPVKKRTLGGA